MSKGMKKSGNAQPGGREEAFKESGVTFEQQAQKEAEQRERKKVEELNARIRSLVSDQIKIRAELMSRKLK